MKGTDRGFDNNSLRVERRESTIVGEAMVVSRRWNKRRLHRCKRKLPLERLRLLLLRLVVRCLRRRHHKDFSVICKAIEAWSWGFLGRRELRGFWKFKYELKYVYRKREKLVREEGWGDRGEEGDLEGGRSVVVAVVVGKLEEEEREREQEEENEGREWRREFGSDIDVEGSHFPFPFPPNTPFSFSFFFLISFLFVSLPSFPPFFCFFFPSIVLRFYRSSRLRCFYFYFFRETGMDRVAYVREPIF